ncbi:MAG: HYR domain-containing protein [Mariprofundales bacterium]
MLILRCIIALLCLIYIPMLTMPIAHAAGIVALGDAYANSPTTVSIPLSLANNNNALASMVIQVQYDSAQLSITATDIYSGADLPATWTFDAVPSPPATGTMRSIDIQLFDINVINLLSIANASLATLNFTVRAGVTTDATLRILGIQVLDANFQDIYTTANYGTQNGSIIYGVQDITPPIITQAAAIYAEAVDVLTVVSLPIPIVSDNVDMGLIASADNTGPYSVGTHLITWSARDSSGNIGTITQEIIVQDTIAPIISQPADIIIAATDSYGTAATNNDIYTFLHSASAFDVVGVITTLPTNDSPIIFPLGITTVTFTATDLYGNTATPKTALVTIIDQTPPVITPPADMYVEATGASTTVNWGVATVTDNVDIGLVAQANRFNPLGIGVTIITWSVSDVAGNITTAMQTITISDTTAPNIIAPANITVAAVDAYGTASNQINIAAFLGGASANDVVNGAITPTNNAPNTLPIGITTVTFTATDTRNNSNTTIATITVVDQTPPVIIPPANITIAAIDIYGTTNTDPYVLAFLNAVIATDNVNIDVYGVTNDVPVNLLLGTTLITFTATDIYGNSSSATALLTVQNQTAPLVQAPAAITVAAVDVYGVAAIDVYVQSFLNFASAIDSGGQALTVSNNAPVQLPIGITTVIFTATDFYAHIGIATSTISVVDMQAPQLSLPTNLILAAQDAGGMPATDFYAQQFLAAAIAFDNVDAYTIVQNNAPAVFPIGDTVVQFVSSDLYGNTANATALVQVRDLQQPVVNAPAAIIVNAVSASGTSTTNGIIASFLNSASAIDNVDGIMQTITNNAPNPVPLGMTTIIFSVIDGYGNIGQASSSINVVDNIAPQLIVPGATSKEATGTLTPIGLGIAVVIDNVDQNLQGIASNRGPFGVGIHTITWTVQDKAGNSATGTQIVTITDTTPPAISTPAPVTLATNDVFGVPVNDVYAQAWLASVIVTDAVEGTMAASNNALAQGGFFPIGQTTVTFTASDSYGNTARVSSTITVADMTAPVVIAPMDLYVNSIVDNYGNWIQDANEPSILAFLSGATVSDNVSVIANNQIVNNVANMTKFPFGTTLVTFSATDFYGNTGTATANIIVSDLTPPTIISPVDIYIEATARLTLVNIISPTASDNIDPAPTISQNPYTQYFPVGVNIVTWTAADIYGNTSSVIQTITISDTTLPTITPPPALVVPAVDMYGTPMTDSYVQNFLRAATANDIVSGSIITSHNIITGTVFSLGMNTVIWTAIDESGNSITASSILEVTDQTPPIITPPIDLYVFANDVYGIAATDVYVQSFLHGATAIDNVVSVLPAISNDVYAMTQFSLGLHPVTFMVSDSYGNTATALAYIVVQDGAPIMTTVPSDQYINAVDAAGIVATHPDIVAWLALATATDNINGVIIPNNDAPFTFPLDVTTMVTFSAIDSYGNITTATANLTINDLTSPVIIPPANIVLAAVNAAGAPSDLYVQNSFLAQVTASDNVDASVLVSNNAPAQLPLGVTAVSFSTIDAAGNSSSAIATITVIDQTPPNIQVPAPITINATTASGIPQTDPYIASFLQAVSAQDNVDGIIQTTNNAPTLFAMGSTSVTFSAQDAVGNITNSTVSVLVNNMSNTITNWQSGLILAARGRALNDVYTVINKNLIVVVGDKGLVLTSSDGLTWVEEVSGTFEKLNGITWDGGQFIAVGTKGTILTSPDAKVWTADNIATSMHFERVIFAHNKYVAVGWFGTLATSYDAIIWTLQTPITNNHLFAVGADANQFIAIGLNGTILTSPDAIIWTRQISNSTDALYAISFDGTQTMIIGLNGTVLSSLNGSAWTVQQSGTTTRMTDMIWGNGQFVAVGEAGMVLSSPNGINWTQQAAGATTSLLNSVTWTGSAFVAVGQWGATLRSGVAASDLIKPIVSAPANITLTALDVYGIAANDASMAAFLNAATAWDNIDGYTLVISNDAPAIFPQGTTTVTFSATDIAANTGLATALVTVSAPISSIKITEIPTLIGPNNGNNNVSVPVAGVNLQWQISNPNPLYTYTLVVSSDNNFTNIIQQMDVTTQVLASSPILLGFMFGMLAWYRRRIILAGVLIISCVALLSCGGGGSANVTTTNNNIVNNIIGTPILNNNNINNNNINNNLPVQQQAVRNLQAATTYFWKMVVNDNTNSAVASSAVWQFTTQ